MFQLVGVRLFETEDLAALRIDPGHDVPDGTVLASRIHPLKNQQHRITVVRIVQLLQRAQCFNVFFQKFFVVFLRLAKRLQLRRTLLEFKLASRTHAEIL